MNGRLRKRLNEHTNLFHTPQEAMKEALSIYSRKSAVVMCNKRQIQLLLYSSYSFTDKQTTSRQPDRETEAKRSGTCVQWVYN